MKIFLLLFIMLIFGGGAYAQKIEGISDFKIGISVSEFLNLSTIKNRNQREKTKLIDSVKGDEVLITTSNTVLDRSVAGGIKLPESMAINEKIYSTDIEKYEFTASLGIPDMTGKDSYKMTAIFYKKD